MKIAVVGAGAWGSTLAAMSSTRAELSPLGVVPLLM